LDERIRLIIREHSIAKLVGNKLELLLDKKASTIDAIVEADRIIKSKGGFPLPEYLGLLHMVYNPLEKRFYKQVAISAYSSKGFINVKNDPSRDIPDKTILVLILNGGCISEWEEVIDREEFLQSISKA
jgi:hypothetical protein